MKSELNKKVWLVGGAVRDKLLGLQPQDLDFVVVNSTPEEMLSEGFTQVGADFPVFLHPDTGQEYALARTERKTGSGYLGFEVNTENVSLNDDLFRRDLTINAMAMSEENDIVDPFNGREDLKNKILRHVSNKFVEDPLRVIRLGRFFARYSDFMVAEETAILSSNLVKQGELNHLATERFWAELAKTFKEKQVERFFTFLQAVKADQHVEFFNNLYGELSPDKLEFIKDVAKIVQPSALPASLILHTAITASRNSKTILSADTRTQALFKNLNNLRSLQVGNFTPDQVFSVLKSARAWSEGTSMLDLCAALAVATKAGEVFAITPIQLYKTWKATKSVKSANYISIYGPGKALGKAIDEGRKIAIDFSLNLHI